MPLTTADIGIQFLMDTTAALQEIEARLTALVFAAVYHPDRQQSARKVYLAIRDTFIMVCFADRFLENASSLFHAGVNKTSRNHRGNHVNQAGLYSLQ